MLETVIVRAHMGEPLRRVVVNCGNGRIYVANPEALQAVENGESSPIGFPEEDVFSYDDARFKALEVAWRLKGELKRDGWAGLSRYKGESNAKKIG